MSFAERPFNHSSYFSEICRTFFILDRCLLRTCLLGEMQVGNEENKKRIFFFLSFLDSGSAPTTRAMLCSPATWLVSGFRVLCQGVCPLVILYDEGFAPTINLSVIVNTVYQSLDDGRGYHISREVALLVRQI